MSWSVVTVYLQGYTSQSVVLIELNFHLSSGRVRFDRHFDFERNESGICSLFGTLTFISND